MNKKTKIIILIFLSVFVIKSVLTLFINGPFILSTEACFSAKAMRFIENLDIKSCSVLTEVNMSDVKPLYSMLISPIYLFASGTLAYKLILILNALLGSLIIFPLYGIFNKFIKNFKFTIPAILIVAFLPQIISHEKAILDETLFFAIGISFLYFYIKSFEKDTINHKALALLFAFLAIFTNPIGPAIAMALILNEIILAKNKKAVALIYIPGACVLSYITLAVFAPELRDIINYRLYSLAHLETYQQTLIAIKNTINSFTITLFYIPIIVLMGTLFKTPSPLIQKTRYFLLAFLTINFILAFQNIENFQTPDYRTGFLTKPILISIIFIYIYSIALFTQIKKHKLNTIHIITHAILILSLIFIEYSQIKLALNIDIAHLYDTSTSIIKSNMVIIKPYFFYILLGIIIMLNILLYTNKKKLLAIFFAITLISSSIFSTIWIINFTKPMPKTTKIFEDTDSKILFLGDFEDPMAISFSYWKLLVRSSSYKNVNFSFTMINEADRNKDIISLPPMAINEIQSQFDYLISNIKFDLEITETIEPGGTGSTKPEYVYKLK